MAVVTKEMIEKDIENIKYIYEGRSVLCIVTLTSGFSAIGKAQCSPYVDYSKEMGEVCSLEDAFDKLFEVYTFYIVHSKHLLVSNPKPFIPSTAPISYHNS